MKKQLKGLLLVVASVAFLAACGRQGGKAGTTTSSSSNGQPIRGEVALAQLFGDWESVDEPERYYLSLKEAGNKTIVYAPNLTGEDSLELTVDTNEGNTITALTPDKKNRYQFVFEDEQRITAFFGVNTELNKGKKSQDQLVGLSKPIVYRRVNPK